MYLFELQFSLGICQVAYTLLLMLNPSLTSKGLLSHGGRNWILYLVPQNQYMSLK